MAGIAVADALVLRGIGRPARVAGDGVLHAFDMLEHPLNAPEAATGEHRGFAAGLGGFVEGGRWKDYPLFGATEGEGRALADDAGSRQPQQGTAPGKECFHGANS
ncbi:hypothetical protein D3C86_1996400 [compost metagenome]